VGGLAVREGHNPLGFNLSHAESFILYLSARLFTVSAQVLHQYWIDLPRLKTTVFFNAMSRSFFQRLQPEQNKSITHRPLQHRYTHSANRRFYPAG
jgi:phosphopantetheinyl transferase